MDSSEKIDLHAEPASKTRRIAALWLIVIIGGVPALATLLAFGGRWWWPLDILSHFRVQYATVLAIMLVLMTFIRQGRWLLLLVIPLAINIALIGPLYLQPRWLEPHPEFLDQEMDRGPSLQLMTYNIGSYFQSQDESLELIRQSDADIIVLQEVEPEMLKELEYAVAPFRVFLADPREDGFGVALLLRVSIRPQVALKSAKLIRLPDVDSPNPPQAIEAHLLWQNRPLVLLTFQAAAPLSFEDSQLQSAQFKGVAAWVKAQNQPVIVIGDLNTTPWSYRFSDLLKATHLQNSQLGFGVQGSWPATGGFLGQIPLDHCLTSTSLMAVSRKIGPSLSSSHHAVNITLQWSGGASTIETPVDVEPFGNAEHQPPRQHWRRGRGERRRNRPDEDATTQPTTQPTTRPAATKPASAEKRPPRRPTPPTPAQPQLHGHEVPL